MTGERKREARRFLLPLSALLYVSDKDFTYIIYGVWEREGERERKRIYKISSLVEVLHDINYFKVKGIHK